MARYAATVDPPWDAGAWRAAARAALRAQVPPEDIDWLEAGDAGLLPGTPIGQAPAVVDTPRVPRSLVALAEAVACHRAPGRFALLYRLLWRITHGEPQLLAVPTDADVHQAAALLQAVRRDTHKMKAFVRFRAVAGEQDAFIAWFEPDHRIVDRVAPFFARRFTGMRWAILTPDRSARWDGSTLSFGTGALRSDAPAEDAHEDLWRTYYAHIFNPARLNPRMMRQEMPTRYWKHLPEAQLLPELTRTAGQRVREMAEREAVAPKRRIPKIAPVVAPTPAAGTLDALRAAAQACRACPLWEPATQTVFGEGPPDARVLLVGEQPGDAEDLTGRPFVGPSGQVLDRALAELGIARDRLYLTNAVKHFRFERRGKQRLHRNPEVAHVDACRGWLAGEIERVRPEAVACLGATAALAVFGAGFRLMDQRGSWHTLHDGTRAFATVHPAWVLRQRGKERDAAYATFVADLALLGDALA
ncbi:UdgX family uracil-DNA binding protein [Luteimonas vadosa]|uniref:Type-4 uracil-DNA glycosylase n=1 Tax=Luteimonas vadosa TaxID=1165507 RepID=A0ABP9DS68_9GAMM